MKCEKCGMINHPNQTVCSNCGANLQNQFYNDEYYEDSKPRTGLIIGIVIAVVVIIAGVLLFFTLKSKTSDTTAVVETTTIAEESKSKNIKLKYDAKILDYYTVDFTGETKNIEIEIPYCDLFSDYEFLPLSETFFDNLYFEYNGRVGITLAYGDLMVIQIVYDGKGFTADNVLIVQVEADGTYNNQELYCETFFDKNGTVLYSVHDMGNGNEGFTNSGYSLKRIYEDDTWQNIFYDSKGNLISSDDFYGVKRAILEQYGDYMMF